MLRLESIAALAGNGIRGAQKKRFLNLTPET